MILMARVAADDGPNSIVMGSTHKVEGSGSKYDST